jgi:hypothetical protein
MVSSDHVTVYSFRVFDSSFEVSHVEPFKATRQAIERLSGAQVLDGTAEDVDSEELDSDGHWRRVPTGWGAL